MIDALKDDQIIKRIGGRFKLTALMQKRWLELMNGARPMVDTPARTELDVIAAEIQEEKITAEFVDAPPPPSGETRPVSDD